MPARLDGGGDFEGGQQCLRIPDGVGGSHALEGVVAVVGGHVVELQAPGEADVSEREQYPEHIHVTVVQRDFLVAAVGGDGAAHVAEVGVENLPRRPKARMFSTMLVPDS